MADENFDDSDDLDYYHDDPDQEINDKPDRKKNIIIGFCASVVLILSAIFYLPSSIGGRITINTGNTIQFAQGSISSPACTGADSIKLQSESRLVDSDFKISKIRVSDISVTCRNVNLNIAAYNIADADSLNLAGCEDSLSVNISSDATFTYLGNDSLTLSKLSDTSFELIFTNPIALSESIKKFTLISSDLRSASSGAQSLLYSGIPTFSGGGSASVPWKSVTYGNCYFVALSEEGKIARSTDGISWAYVTSLNASGLWTDITYGEGYGFVAVGKGITVGNIATSPDGSAWTTVTLTTRYPLYQVAYGGGNFVVVSQAADNTSRTGYSTDGGVNWSFSTNGLNIAYRELAFGNGVFIASSFGGRGQEVSLLRSTNLGLTWATGSTTQANNYSGVATNGSGKWAVLSSNGTGAVLCDLSDGKGVFYQCIKTIKNAAGSVIFAYIGGTAITYGDGKFLIAGGAGGGGNAGTLWMSSNVIDWQASSVTIGTDVVEEVAYGNKRFVFVRSTGPSRFVTVSS